MGAIGVVLLVVFVVISVLLILIVLAQGEETNGMGGVFGASNSVAFGARSSNVLTKTTYVLVTLFFLSAIGLAFVYRSRTPDADIRPIVGAQEEVSPSSATESWIDAEAVRAEEPEAVPEEVQKPMMPSQEAQVAADNDITAISGASVTEGAAPAVQSNQEPAAESAHDAAQGAAEPEGSAVSGAAEAAGAAESE